MIVDAKDLAGGERFAADVCVVGAGAAGVTLALELAAGGHAVVLVESGGFEYEQGTQALYSGTESGTILGPESQYLGSSRLRFLGGTTGHWNGWCRPLDGEDLELRPWVGGASWPITRAELDPYYGRASKWLKIRHFDYEQQTAGRSPHLLEQDEIFETGFFHLSADPPADWEAPPPTASAAAKVPPPVRFGLAYRQQLADSTKVTVLLNTNLRHIRVAEGGDHVYGLELARLDGTAFEVEASYYTLACGGIENARLLLANRAVHTAGLGNEHDQVGRYFMDHPYLRVGFMVAPYWRRLLARNYTYVKSLEHWVHGVLRVRDSEQRARELLNGVVIFERLRDPYSHPLMSGVEGLVESLHRADGHPAPEPETTYFGWVLVHGEQSPNPESRVTLGEETDALGVPRSRLDWRLRDRDAASLIETARLFSTSLGAQSRGRLKMLATEDELWPRVQWSWHHMGTTRMHEDPARGVVDANCRLHAVDNLYVAGSSVFTTSGASNPTYTIVALAVRLGEHLGKALDDGG